MPVATQPTSLLTSVTANRGRIPPALSLMAFRKGSQVGTKGPVHGAVLVAALAAAMIGAPVASAGQSEAASAVVSTAHFAIYSDLATNVHDALIADAGARRGRRPAPFDAGPEKACF